MAIGTELKYASIEELYLDPLNPRIGRHKISQGLTQEELLELMREWTLDELAISYLESGGFWTHEALLVVKENLDNLQRLIVVEGNRRLAALKYLYLFYTGQLESKLWERIAHTAEPHPHLFSKIPYLLVDSRGDVQAFLGFRHVTGIKQWNADEKAGFIAKLIDEQGLTYDQVMRKIGSKTSTVRQHYLAYKVLLQMEKTVEDFDPNKASKRFAILYDSLKTEGVKQYLQLDTLANPKSTQTPIPSERLNHLANFTKWLYGTENVRQLVTDTRDVSDFGKILESADAIKYLEENDEPSFDVAYRIAGGDEAQTIRYVQQAAHSLELALMRAHAFRNSPDLQKAVKRLGEDTERLLELFPSIRAKLSENK